MVDAIWFGLGMLGVLVILVLMEGVAYLILALVGWLLWLLAASLEYLCCLAIYGHKGASERFSGRLNVWRAANDLKKEQRKERKAAEEKQPDWRARETALPRQRAESRSLDAS